MADIDGTREFNFLELDGDYDLFGDGSVMIYSTPGHTIGHQSMKVKIRRRRHRSSFPATRSGCRKIWTATRRFELSAFRTTPTPSTA